jgi:hypothetical protein
MGWDDLKFEDLSPAGRQTGLLRGFKDSKFKDSRG